MAEKEKESDWIQSKEKRSEIWTHLLINSKDNNIFKCKHCDTTFRSYKTTTSYRYHMQHKHNLCKVVASTSAASQNNDESKVTSFFTKKSA